MGLIDRREVCGFCMMGLQYGTVGTDTVYVHLIH
jgi:hypothetical protein